MAKVPVTIQMLADLTRRAPLRGVRSAYIGVAAALRAPFWVTGSRLRVALESESSPASAPGAPDPEMIVALRVANGTVRHLSRAGAGWRNTCLYRSMAQYLVLRSFGRSASVRIGVKGYARHQDDKEMKAHSWVVYHGPEPVEDGAEAYTPLSIAR